MSPQGVDFGFIAGNMEEYNGNYNSKNITTAGPSAYYQEVFCRLLETVSKNEELKDLDWSFDPDPNSLFQGKTGNYEKNVITILHVDKYCKCSRI
ncbi:MAG: hypothetical protein IPP06_12610 [Saprospiraceae bacterium]|nr:hypothetical protein [Candidatus Vicinibacter affinis]